MQRCFSAALQVLFAAAFVAWGLPGFRAIAQELSAAQPTTPTTLSPEIRGDLAMARQQYIAAIEAYREAPAESAQIWNKIGLAYHHLFAVDEARRDYMHALRLQPDYPEALNNLGAVYYAKGNFRKAEKYYHRSIQLDAKSAAVYSNLGTTYFAEQKFSEGIAAYRRAFALDPHIFEEGTPQLVNEALPVHSRAQQDFCLAKLFAQAGHYDRAIDLLRRALNEGFTDRKEILQDESLASLRTLPEFTLLMAEEKLQ
ncbi:MAG TPA: tetratricopeptide repeat protein [Acidobacteriaceae bacterium]|nr:tetratricopeptide repeat protein [Acidobacteriaceae bacterium]